MTANIHAASKAKRRRAIRMRCWLNGKEVTHRCHYADTRRGVVRLLKRNAKEHDAAEELAAAVRAMDACDRRHYELQAQLSALKAEMASADEDCQAANRRRQAALSRFTAAATATTVVESGK
jgi:hypothetical protein